MLVASFKLLALKLLAETLQASLKLLALQLLAAMLSSLCPMVIAQAFIWTPSSGLCLKVFVQLTFV